MSDPSLPLQAAVVAALKACAPLVAIVGAKIFDRVPQALAAPYVRLTGWQVIADDAECVDGAEVFFDVQAYSTGQGREEVAAMAEGIQAALRGLAPELPGFAECQIRHRTTLYFLEDDGLTERAVVNFQALIDPA